MLTLAVQIAPQRSTQYTDLVTVLAPHEIALSPLGDHITGDITAVNWGGQGYLTLTLDAPLDDTLRATLDQLAMTGAVFILYDALAGVDGPLLKPLDVPSTAVFPPSLVETRRYRGKTNELFTQFLCNVARHSSDYARTPWHKLTLLDPLAGGGTTLFTGLTLGADVCGIEQDKQVVDGTVGFLKQYVKEARISAQFREDKLKGIGKRSFITFKEPAVRCVVGRGDTTDVAHFVNGLKRPQLIVTDLPYGIQHRAEWGDMLVDALPAWADVLAEGGALAFAWDATRLPRADMIALVQEVSPFTVIDTLPYNALSHQVDRVIKQRDVIVARTY